MVTIVDKENKILREIAQEVAVVEIPSKKIQKIITDMKAALHSQDDGVAIAAPQIGESLRIFIVSGKVFDADFLKEEPPIVKKVWPQDMVCINPILVKASKEKVWLEEGCLSVRWLYGKTRRSKNATIECYDEAGNKFKRGAGGLLAQIFQHEIEHLDGILFIDHAKDIVDMPPSVSSRA